MQTRTYGQGPRPSSARWLWLAHENLFVKFFRFYGILVQSASVPSWSGHIFKFSQHPRLTTSNCSLACIVYQNFNYQSLNRDFSSSFHFLCLCYCNLSLTIPLSNSFLRLSSSFGSNLLNTLAYAGEAPVLACVFFCNP